jgi:hypothetical protein
LIVVMVLVDSVTNRLKLAPLVDAVTVGPLFTDTSTVASSSVVPVTVTVGLLVTLLSEGAAIVSPGAVWSSTMVRVSVVVFPAMSVAIVVIRFEPVESVMA